MRVHQIRRPAHAVAVQRQRRHRVAARGETAVIVRPVVPVGVLMMTAWQVEQVGLVEQVDRQVAVRHERAQDPAAVN